jgi:membrane protein implicated in regulation of membrane protease activity
VENGRTNLDRHLPRPSLPEQTPKTGSWISILLAAVAALSIVAGLFVLMLQFGGPLAIVAVLVFAIGGVIALFHYIVWGWWLGRTIREEVESEERKRQSQGE